MQSPPVTGAVRHFFERVKKRKSPNRIAAAGKISSTMPPVEAPAPEPWAEAGEINISTAQQAAMHNGKARKRFMILALRQPFQPTSTRQLRNPRQLWLFGNLSESDGGIDPINIR